MYLMDNKYFQNILGSPYVNEGAFNRLKARGAQAIGAMGAMAGHQIQNPTETRLKSLWNGFISSLETVMTDWKSQVSPMFGTNVKLDAASRQIRKNLDSLAQGLKPSPRKLTKEGIWDVAQRAMSLNRA